MRLSSNTIPQDFFVSSAPTLIYVHKILPLFLLPTGIALILIFSGLALRRRGICWIGIGVLWLASTPLVADALMRTAEGWETRRPVSAVPNADAIVVLSSGRSQPPGENVASEWGNANRFYGGVDLYKAGKAPLLIFTGGWAPWQPDAELEGQVLIRYALDLGVPRDRMLTTPRVRNTEEEGRAVMDVLKARPGAAARRVVLVTSAFHMRRAQLLFAQAGFETVAFPVDFRVSAGPFTFLDLLPSSGSLNKAESALRELYGLAYYSLVYW